MPAERVNHPNKSETRRQPVRTPDAAEQELTSLAVELAAKQLRDGSASAQVITHYLKLASPRESIEREKLRNENELLKAKVSDMASGKRIEDLMGEALDAFRAYSGKPKQDHGDLDGEG